MIDREVQIEALWAYEIEKIHMRVTENSLISKTEVDVSFENFLSSYLDLLNYLIENKGDIQSVMAEHGGLQKIANDTIDVVQHQFTNLRNRDSVIEMIKKYIHKLDEIDM